MKSKSIFIAIFGLILSTSFYAQDIEHEISRHDSIFKNVTFSRATDSLHRFQNEDFIGIIDTSFQSKYPFINFDQNHYQFYTQNSPNFEKLFYELRQMIKYKDRKLNFYHIGGSHIQADIYTDVMREHLQTYWDSIPGERGLIFPFNLAHSNNPWNYRFSSENEWKGYRSVLTRPDTVDYGLEGVAMSCMDSLINIQFEYRATEHPTPISSVRIYHNKGELPYTVRYHDSTNIINQITNKEMGYTDTYFRDEKMDFEIDFIRKTDSLLLDSLPVKSLFIYGFRLSNQHPGITYNGIGSNGADIDTYIDNPNFKNQLRDFPPDYFAFSLGTNDGNTTYAKFKPERYQAKLEQLIQNVLAANPECAIVITVPNDALYRRRYLNKNIAREREMIIELAEKYEFPVWDLYGIMGELGSSRTWKNHQLMKVDYVHFSKDGYLLKGDLFFEAFLKWIEQMEMRTIPTMIKR